MAIPLGRPRPGASRDLPGRRCGTHPIPARAGTAPPLSGLAPGGVYRAAPVAGRAVRSYRTLSPLPSAARIEIRTGIGGLLSVALSLGSPPAGRYPAPCFHGARTFLPPPGGEEQPSRPSAPGRNLVRKPRRRHILRRLRAGPAGRIEYISQYQ